MYKSIIKYYERGFHLLNENLIIYFIALFINLGSRLNVIFSNFVRHTKTFPILLTFLFITIPLNLLLIGYIFAPPILFNEALQKKKITIDSVIQAIKKMFPKTFLYALAWLGITLLWFGIINSPTHPRFSNNFLTVTGFLSLFIFPLFSYFAIYFALKDESFSTSVVDSVRFASEHIFFTYLVVIYSLLLWLPRYFHFNVLQWWLTTVPILPRRYNPMLFGLVSTISTIVFEVVGLYITSIIQATFLIYYKENNKEKYP